MNKKQVLQFGLSASRINYSVGEKNILSGIDLNIPNGEKCLIIGPSGSGKTTLLSILCGLQKPSDGSIKYGEQEIYELNENRRDQFRGENIGILFQTFHLIKSLTVLQNLLLTNVLSNTKADLDYANDLLLTLGLKEKENQNAATLSIGEAQRLSLARAMVGKPKWLYCDEPTSSLDDNNTEKMMNLLIQESEKIGTSLIIVTHDSRVKQYISDGQTIELKGQS